MAWPVSQDYNEAIQTPASTLADPELKAGQAVLNSLGLPMPRSGNFADVYEFQDAAGSKWAIKCFTREIPGLQERYSEISKHLLQAKLPFTVDFQYQERGIRVHGEWHPILKMRWVEGLLFNEFVRDALTKKTLLDSLGQIWLRMGKRLREANLAHADLQHGNVILVPGSKATSLAVKLIDYDGMYVPGLAGKKSAEVGHPAYQHPQRLREGTYSVEVDRFSLLAIYCALRSLAAEGRNLWERYDNGDNFLFREADFRQPGGSSLLKELWQLPDAAVHDLVGHVVLACRATILEVPPLEAVAEEQVKPLTPAQEEKVNAILGPGAKVQRGRVAAAVKPSLPATAAETIRSGPPPKSSPSPADDAIDVDPYPEPVVRRTKPRREAASRPIWPWAVGGGVLLVLVAVTAFLIGQKSNTPPEEKVGQAKGAPEEPPKKKPPVIEKKDPQPVIEDKGNNPPPLIEKKEIEPQPVVKNINPGGQDWTVLFGPRFNTEIKDGILRINPMGRVESAQQFDVPFETGAVVRASNKQVHFGALNHGFSIGLPDADSWHTVRMVITYDSWEVWADDRRVFTGAKATRPKGKVWIHSGKDNVIDVKSFTVKSLAGDVIVQKGKSASPLDVLNPASIAPPDRWPQFPELAAVVKGYPGEIWDLAFAPDSTRLIYSGSDKNSVFFWKLNETGAWSLTSLGAQGAGRFALSPDGQKFALQSERGGAFIFDIAGAQPKHLTTLKPPNTPVTDVAYAPDGKTLALAVGNTVELWDVSGPQAKPGETFAQDGEVKRLILRNGEMATVSGKTLSVWGLRPGPASRYSSFNNDFPICSVAWSPDRKFVAVGDEKGAVTLLDLNGPVLKVRWQKNRHRQWAGGLAFAPDSQSLVSTEGGLSPNGPHRAIWWNAADGSLRKEWDLPERCAGVAFDPSGRYLALGCHNHLAYILRLQADQPAVAVANDAPGGIGLAVKEQVDCQMPRGFEVGKNFRFDKDWRLFLDYLVPSPVSQSYRELFMWGRGKGKNTLVLKHTASSINVEVRDAHGYSLPLQPTMEGMWLTIQFTYRPSNRSVTLDLGGKVKQKWLTSGPYLPARLGSAWVGGDPKQPRFPGRIRNVVLENIDGSTAVAGQPPPPPNPNLNRGPVPPGGQVILSADGELKNDDPKDKSFPNARHKTYALKLLAGKFYVIELIDRGGSLDPYLRLEDSAGKELAKDDDSGGGLNARIVFPCPRTDVYRIIATALGKQIGLYRLTVREYPSAPAFAKVPVPLPPPPPTPLPKAAKLPVPTAKEIAVADKQVRFAFQELFVKDDFGSRFRLMHDLFNRASFEQDPAVRYVCLVDCRDVAAQRSDFHFAFTAIRRLQELYIIDPLAHMIKVLEVGLKTSSNSRDLFEVALLALDEMKKNDVFSSRAAAIAMTIAQRNPKEAGMVEAVRSRLLALKKVEAAHKKVKDLYAKAEADPPDAAACKAVGRYCAFIKEDWTRGLPLLAASGDEALATPAKKDLANPGDPPAQADAGEAWWTLADKEASPTARKHIHARARFWYAKAFPALADDRKAQAEERLKLPFGKSYLKPGLVGDFFSPTLTLLTKRVDFQIDYSNGFPVVDPKLPKVGLTAKWQGRVWVPQAGRYAFTVRWNGSFEIKVDNKSVISFQNQNLDSNASSVRFLTEGLHFVEISYQSFTGSAAFRVGCHTDSGRIGPQPADSQALIFYHSPKKGTP